ncbi:ferredoxin-type protein NapF [Shimia sp. SDUM112013]|uniref:ferredoxin-type protein NapF n=1 Tax=Shimia sp. SDUM112013 TaxID=3136160 RepID=UPI0032EB8929
MTSQTSRRAFLRGGFTRQNPMRPFGAIGVMAFEDACTKCGDCARACPEGIVLKDAEGYPVVSLARGECTFCSACTDTCEAGALRADTPWTWRAEASGACLSRNAVQCRTCQDHCDQQAIRFRLQPGGNAEPLFDLETCTGCGACVAPCPVGAIQFTQIHQPAEASPC